MVHRWWCALLVVPLQRTRGPCDVPVNLGVFFEGIFEPAPLDGAGGDTRHIQVGGLYDGPGYADGTACTRFSGRHSAAHGGRRVHRARVSAARSQLQSLSKPFQSRSTQERGGKQVVRRETERRPQHAGLPVNSLRSETRVPLPPHPVLSRRFHHRRVPSPVSVHIRSFIALVDSTLLSGPQLSRKTQRRPDRR